MTYQTNIHIKEEPSSPPSIDQLGNATTTTTTTTNIEHHHFSGSVLTYGRNPPGGLSYAGGHSGAPRGVLFPGQQTPVTPPYDVNGEDYKWPIGGPETPASPKSCLKETILSRRRARGEGELENLFEEPKQYKLTKADLERRERRREQNRRAARRCRTKKKIVQTIVCKESEKIGKENEQLHQEIDELRDEIARLHHFIENHRKVCQCPETFNVAGLFFSSDLGVPHEDTSAPMSTNSITDAISDAHQTLGDGANNSFPQPTSLGDSQDMGASCNTYASSSGGLSEKPNVNLPSWDLVNLSSDLPQETFFGVFGAFPQNNSSAEGYALTPANSAHVPFSCVTSETSHEMAEMTCVDPNLVQEQQQQQPVGQLPPFRSILPASQTGFSERRRASPGHQDAQTAPPPAYGTYTAILTASGGHPSRLVCGGQPQGFQANHALEYMCVDAYGQDQESYLNYFNNPGDFSKRVTM
ncbi:unnamed protein product [Lymnaea stagnalis]|uniref:BZIP domain-containing protein n=1 Tax=Lymnaea stagnalis TaxID=6523 RepID=A0AAV2HZI6_LYMST